MSCDCYNILGKIYENTIVCYNVVINITYFTVN